MPAKLLVLEHADPRWRPIYKEMLPGEVRRVWITNPYNQTSIYDVELVGYLDFRRDVRHEPPPS
jgi:hypothetical protein